MTMWFNRKPGDVISPSVDEPGAAIVGDSPPDWVRLPPELGGGQLKVESSYRDVCPKCGVPNVRHLVLQDNYGVAECGADGFVWYRRRAK